MSALPSPEALGLPHRAPFVFVDAVLELQPGEAAVCQKTFPPEQDFFRGHFPGDPLVPGVIITEALAQTAGMAAGQPGVTFHLAAIRAMKFMAPVRPGETLELRAKKRGAVGGVWQFEVEARMRGVAVAEGAVVLAQSSAPGA